MKIEIRSDCAVIDGYVNAVGRDSLPIMPRSRLFPDSKCVEQVVPGTFKKSLEHRSNVDLLINHDTSRKLGSTGSGELTLKEDSIGLRAHAVITDPAAIAKARNGEFRGWSFGMYVSGEEKEERAGDIPRRKLVDIDLFEVSLIDRSMHPCYAGTSVECRADGDFVLETRSFEDETEIVNNVPAPDFSEYEKRLATLRAQMDIVDAEKRLAELRYNPYHDPTNGKFTTANGGGMGAVLHVPVGAKGKGEYIYDKAKYGIDDKNKADGEREMQNFLKSLDENNKEGMINAVSNADLQLEKPLFTTKGNAVKMQEAVLQSGNNTVSLRFHNGWDPTQTVPSKERISTKIEAVVYENGNAKAIRTLVEKKTTSLKNAEKNYDEVLDNWKKITNQKDIKF